MAQTWLMDPTKGDYVMSGGAPVQTDSLQTPAYFRLKAKRQTWLYAPDVDWGSDFHLEKKRKSTSDLTKVENIAARALQPIVDDGRASQIDVAANLSTRNAAGLDLKIHDARGNVERIKIDSLGV